VEIQGERVLIRTTSQGDLVDLMELWNDGRVMHWVGFPDGLGYDREAIQDWFDKLQSNPQRHHFVVHTQGIGFGGEVYYAVDPLHRRASLDIKLRPKAQGQGLATDALNTLIQHVFQAEPDVDSVWTQPSKANTAARALYNRCGMSLKPRPADIQTGESFWELTRIKASGEEFSRLFSQKRYKM
jgi:RimJ/RimL family protein N-acetyltransferase